MREALLNADKETVIARVSKIRDVRIGRELTAKSDVVSKSPECIQSLHGIRSIADREERSADHSNCGLGTVGYALSRKDSIPVDATAGCSDSKSSLIFEERLRGH
jgi:hypothetical protein